MKLKHLTSYFELYHSLKESGKDMVLNDELLKKEKEFVNKEITVTGIVNEVNSLKKEIIVTNKDEDDHASLKKLISTHFFVFAESDNLDELVKRFNIEKDDLISLSGTIKSLHRQSALRIDISSLSVIEKNVGLLKSKEKKGCFIATAVYGSEDAIQVHQFYKFRDEILSKSITGKLFIRFYYFVSPALAKKIQNKPRIKSFIRKYILEKILSEFDFH